MRIAEATFAALDFETTGLFPQRGDRVIEVAIVRGRRGEEPWRWSALVNPERSVGATHVHGLTTEDLAGAPAYAEIAPRVEELLEGAVLVAHNAPFELAFLGMERARAQVATSPILGVLDTLTLARTVLRAERHGLGHVLAELGIPAGRLHRAGEDALGTWHAAWALLSRLDPADSLDVDDACALARRPAAAQRAALAEQLRAARGRRVWIAYAGAELTRREITPTRVTAQAVHAWCHLRQAERRFRLDRVQLVPDPPALDAPGS